MKAISHLACIALLALAACGEDEPDAYGNFEATEVVVSAEAGGRLVRFDPDQGDRLAAGSVVGQIDTVVLALQREELLSRRGAAETRTSEAGAQIGVLQAQLATARSEYARTLRLFRDEAATAQQLDRARGEVRVLEERIAAARATTGTAREEVGGAEARIRQVDEQIRKTAITNPTAGTVLATYAEGGEFVQPGQPLYKVADLDVMVLRAYVSGDQLPRVRIGQRVQVNVDAGEGELRALPGVVSWIAPEAEFTPTPIQTREERTGLVYAIQVRVANRDGLLKIGMPGEVDFPDDGERKTALETPAPGRRP
jgi:HlyD family secretion protein